MVVLKGLLSKRDLFLHFNTFHSISEHPVSGEEVIVQPKPRQQQRRLKQKAVDQLVERYQAGASVRELAVEFGIARTTVLEHLERRGVPRRASTRKLTDADVQVAAHYYRTGESLETVGKRFGVNTSTIKREFRKAGVEIRKRRGWS